MAYTANGVYTLSEKDNGPGVGSVYSRGVSGGATFTLGIKMNSDNVIALVDGVISVPSDNVVSHGRYTELVVTVTGATGTTDVEINYVAH